MHHAEYARMYHAEENLWWYRGLRDLLLTSILHTHISHAKILDAGCGTGKTIEFLVGHGFEIKGFDLSYKAINLCHKRGLYQVKRGNVTSIPFSSSSFDIVIHIDVFGMLNDDQRKQAVKEFRRILKPNGYLIMQSAAFDFLHSSHDVVTSTVKRFTKEELELYFDSTCWKTVKLDYRVSFLFIPICFLKLYKKIIEMFQKKATSDLSYIPPHYINRILTYIQLIENKLFHFLSFPFGSSVFLITKKHST